MKVLIAALFCLSVAVALEFEDWAAFKKEFNKNYDDDEDRLRYEIFKLNVKHIKGMNNDSSTGVPFTAGINRFTDMTKLEVNMLMNGYKGNSVTPGSTYLYDKSFELPSTVDWRSKGLVTEVKDQGQCRSGWAFATTGALEGQQKKKTGKLPVLSEQNLMDCSQAEGTRSCDGGSMDQAYNYIKKNNGIDSEAFYPYQGTDEQCRYNKKFSSATVTGLVDIPSGDEDALKHAVATVGPVSVAIDANHNKFIYYKSGIIDNGGCKVNGSNHAILVVGYGTDNGTDYWLLKNSWGKRWGMDGYGKLARNKGNRCGVATQASYPLV